MLGGALLNSNTIGTTAGDPNITVPKPDQASNATMSKGNTTAKPSAATPKANILKSQSLEIRHRSNLCRRVEHQKHHGNSSFHYSYKIYGIDVSVCCFYSSLKRNWRLGRQIWKWSRTIWIQKQTSKPGAPLLASTQSIDQHKPVEQGIAYIEGKRGSNSAL